MRRNSSEGKFNLCPDYTETSDASMQEYMLNFRDRHIHQPNRNMKEAGEALSRALEILVYKKSR